jgi:haloacetate dehalogenase
MARDLMELLNHLGIERAAIIGHDRGARVGLRFVKDYPHAVSLFAALDNIPTLTIFERMDATIARAHWFFLFNSVQDLPEALIAGREEIWLRFIFSSWCYNPEVFTEEEIATYVAAYSQAGAVRGACQDYRAGAADVEQDRADREIKIVVPTLVLWGEEFVAGGKMWDFREVWSHYAEQVKYVSIPKCGHLPHEEQPHIVNDELQKFLLPWKR